MNLKNIKEKLFQSIFRKEYWTIQTLQGEVLNKKMQNNKLLSEKLELKKALEEQIKKENEVPKPTIADLMRDILGVMSIDFVHVEDDGLPRHFLNIDDIPTRTLYIAQLHEIYRSDVWQRMCDYYITAQANFTVRQADGDLQSIAGRMTINGISLLKKEVERGHIEFIDRSKPPEDFDEFSVELLNEHN